MVYVSVQPLRLATHFDRTPVAHSPEYQRFMDATGIVPERDLDAVAFALHRMSDPNGPNGPVGYSEVFEGHFDGSRLARYLGSVASGREQYAGHEIFTVPVEAGTTRLQPPTCRRRSRSIRSSTGTGQRHPRLAGRRC